MNLFNVKLFGGAQDYYWNWIDDKLFHKAIILLHAQPFYAEQDFPLKLPDDHIVRKGV